MSWKWWGPAAVAAAGWGYFRLFRPWQLTWGALPGEVARRVPGDELVRHPTFNATRAITIAAPPAAVWPWLVQVGVTRAGWYSYDLLDNFARPSAKTILPELQDLAPGDVVPLSPDGKKGMHVYSMDPPRSMVWATLPDSTWAWQLTETADGSTRLVTRVRACYRWFSPSIVFSLLIEFADIWMMRKMLLNLRQRAEAQGAVGAPRLNHPHLHDAARSANESSHQEAHQRSDAGAFQVQGPSVGMVTRPLVCALLRL